MNNNIIKINDPFEETRHGPPPETAQGLTYRMPATVERLRRFDADQREKFTPSQQDQTTEEDNLTYDNNTYHKLQHM